MIINMLNRNWWPKWIWCKT